MVLDKKVRVAVLSVVSNTLLTLSKIFAGIISGSVSIISEGIHSGIDLVAAIIALFAVHESGKPADEKHEYGHGKIENVSGTVEAVLIFAAAIWIIVEAVKKIKEGVKVENLELGLIVMGISVVVNTIVSTMLLRVAKKTDSVALEADGLHLRTDVYTSAGVFIGLLLMKITGWTMFDPLVAIGVALLIFKTAFDLIKEAFMPLVDVSLPSAEHEIIIDIINSHSLNIVEFHNLRTRRAGAERHIDLHLVVPKNTSVETVHELCNQIEKEIYQQLRMAHVLIHVEPCTDRKVPCSKFSELDHHCEQCEEVKK
ncbi:MAG: cation diffusion facilitator family transporter [Desulfitobacteriaceae bacterium]